jgi:DNA-binding MarR family transcriptional regulator
VRGPHPTDRRATLVRLTEHAAATAAALHAEYEEGAALLFGDAPAGELAAFVSVLDRVLARLRAAVVATSGEPR